MDQGLHQGQPRRGEDLGPAQLRERQPPADRGTKRLLRATKGEIWLTETGASVDRKLRKGSPQFEQSAAHAGKVTAFHLRPRRAALAADITHVYLYNWNQGAKGATWDSALVGPDNQPRPAMAVLQRVTKGKGAAQKAVGAPSADAG